MGRINTGRVILGGLLAGVIINIGEFMLNEVILGADWQVAMKALGKETMNSGAMVYFILAGLILGMLAVWLYAAIRPRFGAGPKTAICAGLAIWALSYLYPGIGMIGMNFFPVRFMAIGLIWGLIEAPIATLAGAWLYKET